MKISSLPLRDLIALEALPAYAGKHSHPADATRHAYAAADEMLKHVQDYQCRIKEAEQKAAEAEARLEIVRSYKLDGPDFAPRIALTQMWDALGASDQTAAMIRLRQLLEISEFLGDYSHTEIMGRLRLARSEHSL